MEDTSTEEDQLDSEGSSLNHFYSEMLISEYIEGMMSLSSHQRKILKELQRDRKMTFARAVAAATSIQRSWRR